MKLDVAFIAVALDEEGQPRPLAPLCSAAWYSQALDKIRARWADFWRAGWTTADLTSCALARHGHHGLALYLRPGQDIARIWTWCCEILGSIAGNGERSRLVYWRSAPEAMLRATLGEQVVPAELAEERWREKL